MLSIYLSENLCWCLEVADEDGDGAGDEEVPKRMRVFILNCYRKYFARGEELKAQNRNIKISKLKIKVSNWSKTYIHFV